MSNPYVAQDSYNQDTYTLPGFKPQRVDPVFQHITEKYYCQERVVSAQDQFTSLTWKIQQPDLNMVFRNVKVCIPVTIQPKNRDGGPISPLLSDKHPACNLALSAHLQKAFTDISCTINGRIFSVQPSYYQEVLDVCYVSKDFNSFSSNHSLKPNARRDLRNDEEQTNRYPLLNAGGEETAHWTAIANIPSKVSDHAFDLTFANGPFLERVRDYQRILKGTPLYDHVICFNLQVGPFMDRARKRNNVGVPFIRDFNLRMLWQRAQSEFDINYRDTDALRQTTNKLFPDRTICNGLLEWGSPVNLRHAGEASLPTSGWPSGGFEIKIVKKPYLQVDYVKMGGLEPSYRLRALEYRYEKSNPFSLVVPLAGSKLESNKILTRINTRLNSFPSKCYVYAELADGYKNPFFMGGTYRFCKLSDIKLRINQRTDVINSPEENECFEQFKLLTNNSLEKPTWAKSPVYCFSSDFFGQPDMLSGDGVLNTFEWEANVELSELQCEELTVLNQIAPYAAMGYDAPFTWVNTISDVNTAGHFAQVRYAFDFIHNPGGIAPLGERLNLLYTSRYLDPRDSFVTLQLTETRDQGQQARDRYSHINSMAPGYFHNIFSGKILQQRALGALGAYAGGQSSEILSVKRVNNIKYRFDGLFWGLCNTYNLPGTVALHPIGGFYLWWVPESFLFSFNETDIYQGGDFTQMRSVMNPLTKISGNGWNAANPPSVENPAIFTADITQRDINDMAHLMPQTVGFNRDITTSVCPGMRAYPCTEHGVMAVGFDDYGANAAVQGGLPPEPPRPDTAADIGWKYIDFNANNFQGLRWVAFQGPPSIATGLPATDPLRGYGVIQLPPGANAVRNNGAALPNGDGLRMGSCQSKVPLPVNGLRVPHSGLTHTFIGCDIERHMFGHAEGSRINLADGTQAGLNNNYGIPLRLSDDSAQHRVSGLQYELKCVYEYGEQEYQFSKDGSKPEKINNIVINAAQSFNDPRLEQDYSAKAPVDDSGITYS